MKNTKQEKRYFLVISPKTLKKEMKKKDLRHVAILDCVATKRKTSSGAIMLELI